MKSILISIKPKYVAEILNGRKSIEVRKSCPKCELPCEVYIYCTKEKNKFDTLIPDGENYLYGCPYENFHYLKVNGKVVAKFTLNKVELIRYGTHGIGYYPTETSMNEMAEKSCLYFNEVDNYFKRKNGYAWHIDDLVIFDKPKELKEFYRGDYDEDKVYDEVEERFREYAQVLPAGSNVPAFSFDADKEEERFLEEVKDEYRIKHAPQSWCYCEVNE